MSNKATNTKDLGTNLLNLIDNNSLSDPNGPSTTTKRWFGYTQSKQTQQNYIF